MQLLINQYDFNLSYAKKLVADLSEEQMTHTPSVGFENHPAFTLGHLVSASAMLVEDLGGSFEMPANWSDLFLRKGPGDATKPNPDTTKYPSKNLLLNELEIKHNEVKALLTVIYKHKLIEPVKWRFGSYMPTLFDLVNFMCINHEAMHLGQLAGWRRAMGLPSALAKL